MFVEGLEAIGGSAGGLNKVQQRRGDPHIHIVLRASICGSCFEVPVGKTAKNSVAFRAARNGRLAIAPTGSQLEPAPCRSRCDYA
jgi:hypothetical protein